MRFYIGDDGQNDEGWEGEMPELIQGNLIIIFFQYSETSKYDNIIESSD